MMKKYFVFILCLIFIIISGCKSSVIRGNELSTHPNPSVKLTNTTTQTHYSESEEPVYTQNEKPVDLSFATTSTKVTERYDDSPAADILQFDIKNLKALKTAAQTMTDAEFENYLEENRFELAWFEEVNTVGKLNSLLSNIDDIYIAVFDTEDYNDITLTYYSSEKRIFQAVSFSETRRLAFDFYIDNEPIYRFANSKDAEFIKTIETDSVKADVYEFENREGFCADGVLHCQKFSLRVSEEQTIEEFETDFSRLQFVKIGDLLAE